MMLAGGTSDSERIEPPVGPSPEDATSPSTGSNNRRKYQKGNAGRAGMTSSTSPQVSLEERLWENWLKGLADLGCTFLELLPGEKRSRQGWEVYLQETGIRGYRSALSWLERGAGVGILPKSPLWVLDADSPSEVERIVSICLGAHLIPPMVRTPSGGAHFYFRLPDDFPRQGLKHHLCHPKDADGRVLAVDFKLGSRTLITAPGTRRNGLLYLPAQPWVMPPVADPRWFLPEGAFWRTTRPFLVDTRSRWDRLMRAKNYLETAKISVSGNGGSKVLAGVCSHLVVFLNLDPETVFNLLTKGVKSWNSRCMDKDGQPCAWSNREIWKACVSAVDSVPAAGVKAWVREQAYRQWRLYLDQLIEILDQCQTCSTRERIAVERVRLLFGRFGVGDLSSKMLGDCLQARGIPRIRATGKRIWCIPKLDYRALVNGILTARRAEFFGEWREGGCALNKHRSALERVLSDTVE